MTVQTRQEKTGERKGLPRQYNRYAALICVSILLGTASIYWPSLWGDYVWDDLILFVYSPDLRSGDISWAKLSVPILESTTYFRPFVLFSFAAEFRLLGVDPFNSHAVNLALHLLNVGLVFFVARALAVRIGLKADLVRASFASLVYALHPALTEPVSWISGRFDLFLSTFVLAALLVELIVRNTKARVLLLSTAFFLALASKEAAICLPALLLIQRLLYDRRPMEGVANSITRILKADLATVAALMSAFAIYLTVRIHSMGAILHAADVEAAKTSSGHVLLILNTIGFYIKELFIPYSISALHPYQYSDLLKPIGIATALGSGLILFIVVALAWRGSRAGLVALAIIIGLLPVLHIVPLTIAENIGHDRFLAMPLAFGAVGLAQIEWLQEATFPKRGQLLVAASAALAWLALSVLFVRATIPLWATEYSLWSWQYARYPQSSGARTHFIETALREERFKEIKPVIDKMISEGPLEIEDQLMYSGYLLEIGQREEAKNFLMGVLGVTPRFDLMGEEQGRYRVRSAGMSSPLAYGYYLLAKIQIDELQYEAALESARIALWYQPRVPGIMLLQSNIMLAMGSTEGSNALFESALTLTPPRQADWMRHERVRFVERICKRDPTKIPCGHPR